MAHADTPVVIPPSSLIDCGIEVIDLHDEPGFTERSLHQHPPAAQMDSLNGLARAFLEKPETLLQELVSVAVSLCGADSAGISIQGVNERGETFYTWVATAGQYSGFFNAELPAYPSACAVCLERGRPQIFRVTPKFFELMGVDAPPVTDGLLLPWEVEGTRGTVWIMAHIRHEAFDRSDCDLMEVLANFAAMAIRQQKQQKVLLEQASIVAAAAMANELAHNINNPLQGLMNLVYLAAHAPDSENVRTIAQAMSSDVSRLSDLVSKLLAVPVNAARLQ